MSLDTSNSWDTFLDAYSKVRDGNEQLRLLCLEMLSALAKSKQPKFKKQYEKIIKELSSD